MSPDQAIMDPATGFANGQPINGTSESKTSPPAFLDLADSAARFNGDMNSRVEHKRMEHERQRAAQRRVFEDQMRALEQQQIAEENALLSHKSSPNSADHRQVGHRGQGNNPGAGEGMHHHHLGMPSFNLSMGMALSAPTTPPLASDRHPSANDHAGGGGIYDVVGVSQAIRAAANGGFGGGNGSPAGGMTSNGMTTPTTNSAQSNPFDNGSTNTYSSVIGTPSTHVSPSNRKSVNITPSPEIMQGGGMHQLMQHNLGHFSAGLGPANSSPGMGNMAFGSSGHGGGNGHGNNGNGGGAYGHGAKSMPASRRASAGSKDGGGPGDDLLQGLRGLGLGDEGSASNEVRHGNSGGGRVPGSIVTAGAAGRHAPGPFTSASAFGHSAFLFNTDLDDEMQNSINDLPMPTEDDRFTNLRSSASINFNVGGGAANPTDPYSRKLSVSSAALDLAPLSQTPPRSSFLISRAGSIQHGNAYPAGSSSEWPQFNPPRQASGLSGGATSGMGGLLPTGGVGALSNGSGGMGMYRNGGAMTVGNATPTASGTATPSYPLKAAANVREGGGRLTPNGLTSISQHISSGTTTQNLGRTMGQSPEGRASPSGGAARFLTSDATSSAGGSASGGVGLGFMGTGPAGARSVPATPLASISGSNLGMSLLKTQPIGPVSPAHRQDVTPNYVSDLAGNTSFNTGGRGAVNMTGTPAGMYEPVAYGSISGGNGGVNEDDAIYGSGNAPVQQQQYGGAEDGYEAGANSGAGVYGSVYQTVAPNGLSLGTAAAGMGIGGPMTNAFVPSGMNKPMNGSGPQSMGFGGGSRGPNSSQFHQHGQNRSISYSNQASGRFGHGHQAQAAGGALGAARIGGQGGAGGGGNGSGFGGGDSKMGGLHGPKHKRSDIDREYNRYTGTRLEDLVGELSALCKDQHGCRYLQKKLEENNPEYRDIIFRETFPHFAELMTDPFGNYLCQKLLEFSTDEQRSSICQSVAQDLVQISLNMHGTRAVQKMIDFLSTSRQTDQRYDAQIRAIILALSMHVVTLIKDLNGNHVVQKCLNKLAAEDNQFIYNAVAAHCVEVATHRHGCCVLQRCVDHASESQKVQLVGEITYHALTLVQDPYGNYVVQYILDLNDNRFSDGVIRQFFGNVCALSVQKFSSNVIEKCIRVAEQGTRKLLVDEFLNRSRLEKLLRDSYGNYCVQTALDYAEPDQRRALVDGIRPILPLIRNTPYGKRIQSKLQREQMEAAHQYGGMQGYRHPPNHPGPGASLMTMGMGGNGHHHHNSHGAPSRHVSQPSLQHTGGMMDPYATQSPMYNHTIPQGYNGQSHLHAMGAPGYPTHPTLHRHGSGGSLISDAAYPAGPPYSTPLTTGYNLPPGDHYHPGYAYGV
ncbi:hypothetical protein FRB95_006206 [Tulasnella sp. JGI-2019a]|nr:hypothetical protein FRB95_006206 [Tulasnella sp. JGI-2019a]